MLRLRTLGGLYLESDEVRREDLDGQAQLLALLAVLASAGNRGVSRAAVARIFWPHSVKGSDRTALSTALYRLRGILGAEVVEGSETLCLNSASIGSDLAQFEDSIAAQEFDRAAELYEGEFLQGFTLRGTDSFNVWAEEQRSRLALECRHALESLVSAANERGDVDAAITWLRRLVKHAPGDAAVLKRLEQALADGAVRSTRPVFVTQGPPSAPAAAASPPTSPPLAAQPPTSGPYEPAALPPGPESAEPAHRKWGGLARALVIFSLLAVAVAAAGYAAVLSARPEVRVVTPLPGDTVDVFTTITAETRHEDLWIWIRWSHLCWMRGPFTSLEDGQHTLLAQFGQDAEQSGFPYWFVVLAGPKLAPYQRIEDRQLPDCRYELLDPEAWSDTVLIYRR